MCRIKAFNVYNVTNSTYLCSSFHIPQVTPSHYMFLTNRAHNAGLFQHLR